MKKVIYYFAIAAIAVAVFIGTKNSNASASIKLADLTILNNANAECHYGGPEEYYGTCYGQQCLYTGELAYKYCDIRFY